VLWFVTCRVTEARFWLHPLVSCGLTPPNRRARRRLGGLERHAAKRVEAMVEEANAATGPLSPKLDAGSLRRIARGLVGSVIARAQALCGVEVYAVVVMSSHIHLVVRTPRKNLSAFMGYVDAQIARTVNRITGRRGNLWGRRYDAEPILDDDAAETLTAYALRNPVAANLVDSHHEWPGLNLAYGVGDSDDLDFEWLNCSAWHEAMRPEDLAPFFETVTLRLSPLPHCCDMEREAYGRMLDAWLEQVAEEAAAKDAKRRRASRRSGQPTRRPRVTGVKAVVKTDFRDRSGHPKRTRRPYAFGSAQAKARERATMDRLSQGHFVASEAWRRGDHRADFPPGTYRPPIIQAA